MVMIVIGDGQMDPWSIFIFIVSLASIPLATEMARERGRSRRLWFWMAFIAGPLAAVVLFVLGDRRNSDASHA
jgi:O-antigen/teichoic acid export membrane protein